MEQKTRFSPPAVGGSSLLVIFALLTLTVFSLLSLSTARADQRMADASVEAVSAYYGADLQAERIFARLRNGEQLPEVQISDGIYRYSCPISQYQRLEVALTCNQGTWKVLRWQAVAEPIETAETLPLWDGSAP